MNPDQSGAEKVVPLATRTELIENAINRYAKMIFALAVHQTGSRADADDIFQEVCITLVRDQNAPLTNDSHLKSYLIRVTINKCKDLHKSAWRTHTEPFEEHIGDISPESESILDEVMRLKPFYRSVIYLYYYQGYSVKEIADILDKKENTVSSALRRARVKLKTILEEEGYHG